MLAHAVYFTLYDPSKRNLAAAVAACRELLAGHQGMLHFSVGTRGTEFARPVNDREFDVALLTIFADKSAHDHYQSHPRHVAFVEANQALWQQVRVFDAWVEVG
jgi:hypothetical protein